MPLRILATGRRATKTLAVTFCKNNCLRTFIDVSVGEFDNASPLPVFKSKVPLQAGERRLIISTCEKGQVEDVKRHARH